MAVVNSLPSYDHKEERRAMSKAPQQTAMTKVGDRAFEKSEKISAEFFAITYGSLVRQLFIDSSDNSEAVNKHLEAMGYRIGMRLIDEFVARSGAPPCRNFNQTAEAVASVGLKMFLGISATVENPVADKSYSIVFDENPLNLFVELPEQYRAKLWYSNILCGVIRGALEPVGFCCDVRYVRDTLRYDQTNEIVVEFHEAKKEQFKAQD